MQNLNSGENLIGATVLDSASTKGAFTNSFGFYSLTLPSGFIKLKVSFVGFQSKTVTLELKEDLWLDIPLSSGELLNEVMITVEEQIEQSPLMSSIDVPVEQIKALPVLMGESDILKVLQLLPGIQSGSEGSSGVYVRGGGQDQNLVLLDGVPVYNVSHLFGFFSVFNPDAINHVNVTKGGFPARFGGRLSSVIDISMKEGNNQKYGAEGSIGLISSKLTIDGPIGKKSQSSFIVSGRRTYIDLLTQPIIKSNTDGGTNGGYYFYDVNAKWNYKFSKKDRVLLSFFNGKDKGYGQSDFEYQNETESFKSREKFGLGWGNQIAAIRWNHVYSPKLFSNISGTFSRYQFQIFNQFNDHLIADGESTITDEHIKYYSGVRDISIKADFDYLPVPLHNLRFGISSTNHLFTPGVFGYDSSNESDTTLSDCKINSLEFYSYIENDIQFSNQLRANVGLHYSTFLVDKKPYQSLQPRLSARYLLSNGLSFKASFASMTQYIHLLTNSGIGLPTDLWVPTTDQIKPQTSWQVAVGSAKTYHGYEFSLEAYYKEMNNLIEYKEGSSFFGLSTGWQDKVTSGTGTSYGTELLIQKKSGNLSGWIGYTLSWTNRQFEEINFGKSFPYKYDRRHDLSLVGIYQINQKWSISSSWVYGTGNAITLPKSTYPSNNKGSFGTYWYKEVINYGNRNDYRMAAYHRLDLGLTWTKEKELGVRSWSFGAYNIYNRKNPFYISSGFDNQGNKRFYQYSMFPVLPYFKYSFKI